MKEKRGFTVIMYTEELEYLKWLVLQKDDIETGGDLFGAWTVENNKSTAVVQFVLGPGENCRRTSTSFHQDVAYLESAGEYLTEKEGICNIGEWHSHHRLALAVPSSGDKSTIWRHLDSISGGRFLLFIANIEGRNRVNVGCFMFNKHTREMNHGEMKMLPACSPLRYSFETRPNSTKALAEIGQDWQTFLHMNPDVGRCSKFCRKLIWSFSRCFGRQGAFAEKDQDWQKSRENKQKDDKNDTLTFVYPMEKRNEKSKNSSKDYKVENKTHVGRAEEDLEDAFSLCECFRCGHNILCSCQVCLGRQHLCSRMRDGFRYSHHVACWIICQFATCIRSLNQKSDRKETENNV